MTIAEIITEWCEMIVTQAEIKLETEILIKQGHKRILLVAGESYPKQGFQYVIDSIASVYEAKVDHGEIRRVNVNVAPLEIAEFKLLKEAKIGTYQLFQETYHHETYHQVHTAVEVLYQPSKFLNCKCCRHFTS